MLTEKKGGGWGGLKGQPTNQIPCVGVMVSVFEEHTMKFNVC